MDVEPAAVASGSGSDGHSAGLDASVEGEARAGYQSLLTGMTRDEAELAAMGYQQQLSRGFNGLMNLAFCFTAVSVLPSLSIAFGTTVLTTGGFVVQVWGWLVCSVFTARIIVGCAMGEVCSTYPSAGSVYHWTGQLAPVKWAPLFSFVCGWFNFVGNAAGDASFAYGFAQVVASARTIQTCPVDIGRLYDVAALPGYRVMDTTSSTTTSTSSTTDGLGGPGPLDRPWFYDAKLASEMLGAAPPPAACTKLSVGDQVGIAMAVTFGWALLNITRVDQQGWLNNFSMSWQVTTTIAIVATLLTTTHGHNSSYDVWEIWRNRTGVYNDTNQDGSFGYVLLIGLLGSLFAFSGYEAGAHMAEETTNASKSAPWGIVLTCVMVAVVGFMYILGLLYSIPPSLGVFTSLTTYGNAASSLFAVAKGNNVGLILTNVLVANLFFAGMSSFTVTSRICFAMARDGAIPYGHRFAGVWKRTKTPIGSVALTLVLDCLILLLPLTTSGETFGATNPVAFNAVTSITVIGFQISYAIPLLLRAWQGSAFVRSDFHLGALGVPAAWISGAWLVCTSAILCWPSSFPVKAVSMNYTVVVVGATALGSGLFWLCSARYHFKGPKRVDAQVFKAITASFNEMEARGDAQATLASMASSFNKGQDTEPV